MKPCPRCDAEIGDTATACKCGWKDRTKQRNDDEPDPLRIECAHDACQHRAKVKIKTQTGYANVCMFHYDEHYRLKALNTCAALGLHTTEQRREWTRKAMKELSRNFTPDYNRQPGQDWEEPIV